MLNTFLILLTLALLSRWGLIYWSKFKQVPPHVLSEISIVIPLKGWDHSLPSLITQLLNQNYPLDLEVIIVVDSSNPSLAMLPQDNRVKLVFSQPWTNGWMDKNWRLHQGALEAKYPALLFLDSDVAIDRDYLKRRMGAHRGDFSFCIPFYISPSNAPERFLAAFTNYVNLTLYKASFAFGAFATAIGPSMLLTIDKKILLEAQLAISKELADDHALAFWFSKHGYVIECIAEPVYVMKNDENWRGVFDQVMRWTLLPRTVKHLLKPKMLLMAGFTVLLNLLPALLIYGGLLASPFILLAGLFLLLAETIFFIFIERIYSAKSCHWRHLIFLPLALLSYVFVALASLFITNLRWRGQTIKI